MTSNDRAFNRFVKPVAAAQIAVPDSLPDAPEDGAYRAFKLGSQGRQQLRLRIYGQNDVIALMTYTYLTEVITANHQGMSLIFSNCIIDLDGRNLHALLDPLQDARIRAIYCFRPDRYPAPAEDAPVILGVRREAMYLAQGAHVAANAG